MSFIWGLTFPSPWLAKVVWGFWGATFSPSSPSAGGASFSSGWAGLSSTLTVDSNSPPFSPSSFLFF